MKLAIGIFMVGYLCLLFEKYVRERQKADEWDYKNYLLSQKRNPSPVQVRREYVFTNPQPVYGTHMPAEIILEPEKDYSVQDDKILRQAETFYKPEPEILDQFKDHEYEPLKKNGNDILEMAMKPFIQRIRIVGLQNSGKTTLALHIVNAYRKAGARVIIFDVHNVMPGPANDYTGKWDADEVYGTFQNYQEIEEKSSEMIDLITERLNQVARGQVKERSHKPLILFVAEEMTDMIGSCGKEGNLKTLKTKLMTVARKGGIDYLEIGHTRNAEPSGMKGIASTNKFDLDIDLKIINGRRVCTAVFGDSDQWTEYRLPGAFTEYRKSEKKNQKAEEITGLLDAPKDYGDVIKSFINDIYGCGGRVQAGSCYQEYKEYCENRSLKPVSQVVFGKWIKDRYQTDTYANKMFYQF